ncbi:MAG: hypothetical protein QOE30_4765 [Mycobacterium sp.]|jgi:hypothetical protein|nr:hypothetical protein [Mycobacterium sp.]
MSLSSPTYDFVVVGAADFIFSPLPTPTRAS